MANITHGEFSWLRLDSAYFWLQKHVKRDLLKQRFEELIRAQERKLRRNVDSVEKFIPPIAPSNLVWNAEYEDTFTATRRCIRASTVNRTCARKGIADSRASSVNVNKISFGRLLRDPSSPVMRLQKECHIARANASSNGRPMSAPVSGVNRSSAIISQFSSYIEMSKKCLMKQWPGVSDADLHQLEAQIADDILETYDSDTRQWSHLRTTFLKKNNLRNGDVHLYRKHKAQTASPKNKASLPCAVRPTVWSEESTNSLNNSNGDRLRVNARAPVRHLQ
eukprot:GEMP01048197.1.p1 GENE.GEMP01048197.1~~GEMP01048197.1.p1  ORF type:complete len:279 (+),score=60.19 GEMP01048197.1:95-931(+)